MSQTGVPTPMVAKSTNEQTENHGLEISTAR